MAELPHNPDAENAVLGACMSSPAALADVAAMLVGDDFHSPANETIWDTIGALHAAGEPVDPITVAARMGQDGTLERAGGMMHLADLVHAVTTTVNAAWHARIVRETAARRRILLTGVRLTQLAEGSEGTAADLALTAQAELTAAYRPDPSQSKSLIGDLIDDAIDSIEAGSGVGIPWPWADLNRVLLPAAPGQFILIAARPSVGKSVVCVEIARTAALRRGQTTVIHSLEMSATEIIHRILAAEARVNLTHIQQNTLSALEWERLAAARTRLADAPLHILDNPNVSLADIASSVARIKPAMVVVDYIQLAHTNPKIDRRLGLEEFSRGLKILAKSAGIPIIAAAQLNRGPEKRDDKKPAMADLRETGGLEQDADVVVLLHRPDQAEPECSRAGEIDLIVAKQRNGPTQTVTLVHQLHYSRLADAAAHMAEAA